VTAIWAEGHTVLALSEPRGVTVDASGNLYIADSGNERIRRIDREGIITTIAGTGKAGFSGDSSAATAATFTTPVAVALDAFGNVYVADLDNNRIRRLIPGGAVARLAGSATSIGDFGPSTEARVFSPPNVAVDSSGNLYIADRNINRIRKVTPSGAITTVAGTGQTGRSGDNGPATSAALNTPSGVAVDSGGDLYFADAGNAAIRRVDASTGTITLFAGNYGCCYGGKGTGGDGGQATAATLHYPTNIAIDQAGTLYFTDVIRGRTSNLGVAVRRVSADGTINTWAGGGTLGPGFSGDGGLPLDAQFGNQIDIKTGPDGSLYIADRENNRVRKVDPAGATINTVAGNGQTSASGDGRPATSAGLYTPGR
jgi:sugar lactone lactonase YvrE